MRADAVWSEEYDCFVAPPQPEAPKPVIRFDINKCKIEINKYGFIDLLIGNKKLKRISFVEFKKYYPFVKEVHDDCYGCYNKN